MNSERQTRQERIDLQLGRAGWAVGSRSLIEEFLVEKPSPLSSHPPEPYRAKKEFADYALLDRLGRPLAIVEAKRSSRDPLAGERQAADYSDAIRAMHGVDPFVFLANGDEIWFWHRRLYPPRKVSGFFTEEDLLRLAHLDKFGGCSSWPTGGSWSSRPWVPSRTICPACPGPGSRVVERGGVSGKNLFRNKSLVTLTS